MNRPATRFRIARSSRLRICLALFAILLIVAGRMGDVIAGTALIPSHGHEHSQTASHDSYGERCKPGSDHKDHSACIAAAGAFFAVIPAEMAPPRALALGSANPTSASFCRSQDTGPGLRPPTLLYSA
jgi:hypothetical protein